MVVRHTIDVCAVGLSAACVMQWLPPVAAGLSIIWLTLQIGNFIYTKFVSKNINEEGSDNDGRQ